MSHTDKSPIAGKWVRIREHVEHPQYGDFGGSYIRIEDWWDRLTGGSWMFAKGNPGCLVYAMRTAFAKPRVPTDDEVLYGHRRDGLGSLVHVSEIDPSTATNKRPTPEPETMEAGHGE